MENQLHILSESLDQKIQILEQLKNLNELQERAFQKEEADLEAFDKAVDEKDSLIDSLMKLDDGFEIMYERLSKELQENRDVFASQIKELQKKIARVTELSVSIQAQEARNKKLVEDYFAKTRGAIRQNRQSSKAAYDYYKSMSGAGMSSAHFLDSKQ